MLLIPAATVFRRRMIRMWASGRGQSTMALYQE
jgi:hypothetical protein